MFDLENRTLYFSNLQGREYFESPFTDSSYGLTFL